ncbi:hypothetical protein [Actinoplanes sp. NPDC051851]|uniref:hypothetical protein n=1 Tax=Actinoplanes sp. NPDC051851 TaxID=3154753 RepID=UPI00341410C3
MERFLDLPFFKILRNGVSTFNAVATVCTALTVAGTAVFYFVSHLSADGIAAMVALAPAGLAVVVSGTLSVAAQKLPTAEYRIEHLSGTLIVRPVDGHHSYTNERVQTVRPLRNDTRLVELRSYVTGRSQGETRVESMFPDQVLFDGRVAEDDGRYRRWIYLGAPRGRGDAVQVGVRQTFDDAAAAMLPFYREGGGTHRVKDMTVTVRFSHDEDPDVEGLVWNTNSKPGKKAVVGTLEVKRVNNRRDGTVDYIVHIPRPKRYHCYGFRWRWSS